MFCVFGLLLLLTLFSPIISYGGHIRQPITQQDSYNHHHASDDTIEYLNGDHNHHHGPDDTIKHLNGDHNHHHAPDDTNEYLNGDQPIPYEREANFRTSRDFAQNNGNFFRPRDEIMARRSTEDRAVIEPKRSVVQQREINTNGFENKRMVYPEDWSGANKHQRNTIPPSNCTFGFCEEVADYPVDKILALLKRNPSLKQYFSNLIPVPTIGSRTPFEGETLCDVKTHTKFPKSAKNVQNKEMTIVNVEGHQQGIVFETCGNEKGACRFSEAFPDGYESTCVQKYVQRRLMVVGNANENLLFDTFEFPSCCICTIKKN